MSDIMKLKNATGAGVMDCKEALKAAKDNFEKAVEILREKGKASAAKKADRIAAEGAVASYIHMGGKIGVLLEVNCETDFAAKSEQFTTLVKDISMHIAASNPQFVDETEVPAADVAKEKEFLTKQAAKEGKPAAVIEKMVEGRVKKYYADICLVHQPFVKDPSKTIRDIVTEAIATIGEKITIRRFVRYEMGEGLEKRNENFAEEVAKQSGIADAKQDTNLDAKLNSKSAAKPNAKK